MPGDAITTTFALLARVDRLLVGIATVELSRRRLPFERPYHLLCAGQPVFRWSDCSWPVDWQHALGARIHEQEGSPRRLLGVGAALGRVRTDLPVHAPSAPAPRRLTARVVPAISKRPRISKRWFS